MNNRTYYIIKSSILEEKYIADSAKAAKEGNYYILEYPPEDEILTFSENMSEQQIRNEHGEKFVRFVDENELGIISGLYFLGRKKYIVLKSESILCEPYNGEELDCFYKHKLELRKYAIEGDPITKSQFKYDEITQKELADTFYEPPYNRVSNFVDERYVLIHKDTKKYYRETINGENIIVDNPINAKTFVNIRSKTTIDELEKVQNIEQFCIMRMKVTTLMETAEVSRGELEIYSNNIRHLLPKFNIAGNLWIPVEFNNLKND